MAKSTKSSPLERLKAGNKRFASDRPIFEPQGAAARQETTKGQWPFAAILSCADSRVIPELVFDVGLGELFVVRVAGNIANTESIASLEYAAGALPEPVKLIVVLGHEQCGAVKAAVAGGDYGRHLNQLVAHLQPAVAKTPTNCTDAQFKKAVKDNSRLTAKALRDNSPILAKKSVTIVPAYYNLGSGKVDFGRPV